MSFKRDLSLARDEINMGNDFVVRDGLIVPETTDVGYNEAVKLGHLPLCGHGEQQRPAAASPA